MVLEYIIFSTILVSLISFAGIFFFLFLGKSRMSKAMLLLVSFSAGTMLGASLFDLLPESIEAIGVEHGMYFAFIGILFGFVLEKIIHFHHHHHVDHSREHVHPVGFLTLFGDAFHNFFDGIAIAAAFLTSIPLGISATLAVIFHEIPCEIGDFSLLLYSGYSKKKALFFNFVSALTAIAGGVLFFFFSTLVENIQAFALALTAGTFVYIACTDLLPELHKQKNVFLSLIQLACILAGVGLILFFTMFFEI